MPVRSLTQAVRSRAGESASRYVTEVVVTRNGGSDMAEMRIIKCPECEAANHPLAVVEGIQEFRCRSCGLLYYGPCGCDTVHRVHGRVEERVFASSQVVSGEPHNGNGHNGNGRLPEGFEMLMPVFPLEHAAYVQKYSGCS
jgi:hypothetical protein